MSRCKNQNQTLQEQIRTKIVDYPPKLHDLIDKSLIAEEIFDIEQRCTFDWTNKL